MKPIFIYNNNVKYSTKGLKDVYTGKGFLSLVPLLFQDNILTIGIWLYAMFIDFVCISLCK